MTNRPLFVTGLARSGTNLIGRMLSAGPDVMLAMDPLLPVFRSMRNAIMRKAQTSGKAILGFDPSQAIQDYYFSDRQRVILDAVLDADLKELEFTDEWDSFLPLVKARAEQASQDVADALISSLRGVSDYHDLIVRAFTAIAKARDAQGRKWVGSKDVWTIDFFPALARAFPDAKFIVVVRDPRACIASNHKAIGMPDFGHPLSYARHWRKQIAVTDYCCRNSDIADRVLTVNYEQVVHTPERELERICQFLDIAPAQAMLEPDRYFDHHSRMLWSGNSNFGVLSGFDRKSISAWRKALPAQVQAMTEFVCGPDMRLAGYQPDRDPLSGALDAESLTYMTETVDEACNWRSDARDARRDHENEVARLELLRSPSPSADKKVIRRNFLFEPIYLRLRDAIGRARQVKQSSVPV